MMIFYSLKGLAFSSPFKSEKRAGIL